MAETPYTSDDVDAIMGEGYYDEGEYQDGGDRDLTDDDIHLWFDDAIEATEKEEQS